MRSTGKPVLYSGKCEFDTDLKGLYYPVIAAIDGYVSAGGFGEFRTT